MSAADPIVMNQRFCVITAMRDCAPLVAVYTRMIDNFEVQPTRVIIGVNDSTDGTEDLLRQWGHPALDLFTFSLGVPAFRRHTVSGDEAASRAHLKARCAHLAEVRNRVIDRAMTHDDWDFALMQDAAKMTSPDLPAKLMDDGGDIVAPMSWYFPIPARFYDTWCYRDDAGNPFEMWIPPEVFRHRRLAMNAVGGVYTVKRKVFEDGCRLGGTDGKDCDSVPLCTKAKAKGHSIILRTDLNVTAYGYPDDTPKVGALNAQLHAGDYVSPGLRIIRPDQAFPHMIVGDPSKHPWPYLRRELPHNWFVDERSPAIGFLNRDEVHILYNSALQFRGKRGLEIGCWVGWSACHLALAGLTLDVVDPALSYPDLYSSVRTSLEKAGVLGSVNLVPGHSPQSVEELARAPFLPTGYHFQVDSNRMPGTPASAPSELRRWSFLFIDGDHEHPGPLFDAQVCERLAEPDALVMFHDLVAPAVGQGLEYMRSKGWQTLVYQTSQMMGVAWRGNAKPVEHRPDTRVHWPPLPKHLSTFRVSGLS